MAAGLLASGVSRARLVGLADDRPFASAHIPGGDEAPPSTLRPHGGSASVPTAAGRTPAGGEASGHMLYCVEQDRTMDIWEA